MNFIFVNNALANETHRLDFIYFKPINQAQRTDFNNPVNIIKYHGVYDTTYTPTYTALFEPFKPFYEEELTLADNHESLEVKYENTPNDRFSNAKITALENGDYIVSYEKNPIKPNQNPLIIKRYIKTFDISGEFVRTEVDGKPATLMTSFTNYHALPTVLNFPEGSKCYQWQFHEDTPEFYLFYRRDSFRLFGLDAKQAELLEIMKLSGYSGENNQIAIYSSAYEEIMTDNEVSFTYSTFYDNRYYDDGIKITPKNAYPIDGQACTYLNPIASDYMENLLKIHKDEIIKTNNAQ